MAKGAGPLLLLGGAAAIFLLTRKKDEKIKPSGEVRPLPDVDDEAAFFGKYGFEDEADAMRAMGLLGFESIEHMGQWMGEPVSGELDEQILEWLKNGMELYNAGAWDSPEPMGA